MENKFYAIASGAKAENKLANIPIHDGGPEVVHAFIEEVIRLNQKAMTLNINVHGFNLALQNPWYVKLLNEAQFVFLDGDGVRWGMRMMGMNPPPKIPTTRWIWQLAGYCAKQGFSLYLLGGKPGVAEEAGERLKEKYPDLKIAGTHHGYFEKEGSENDQVVEKINQAAPNLLFVCFGMPAQEKWIRDNWKRTKAHVFLKGGGVYDYVTGRLGQVPEWMIKYHLEWAFRIYEEPKRLFWRYAVDLPLFFLYILREKLRLTSRRSQK